MHERPEGNFGERKKFSGGFWLLENDVEKIGETEEALDAKLKEAGWSEEEIDGFHVAIGEAIANAITYGNLGVSKAETADEKYLAKIREAAQKPENAGKRVKVELVFDEEGGATVSVFDEGPGVDPKKIPDPTEDENILQGKGRGLYLMRKICDRIEFSPGKVTLYKKRKAERI